MNLHHLSIISISFIIHLYAGSVAAGNIARVSVDSNGAQSNGYSNSPTVSADGRYVVFDSNASNLVAGDTNNESDIFIHDRDTGTTTLISRDNSGVQGNRGSRNPKISGDGRVVAYYSQATNLVPGDSNGEADVFAFDRQTGITTRVSVTSTGEQANQQSFMPAISADGQFVAYQSYASNLVAGDTNNEGDIFVYARNTGITSRVSISSTGTQGNDNSWRPYLSHDGRFVAFDSGATNLVSSDANGGDVDVFLHDRETGITTLISKNSSGVQGNDYSNGPTLSADARFVAFFSLATNLNTGNTKAEYDIFVHDRTTGATTQTSVDNAGALANGRSDYAVLSADGRFVVFQSEATNLVAGDTNNKRDIFRHDLQTGITTRISVNSTGRQANNDSTGPALNADGQYIVYSSLASNLVVGDTNGFADIFLYDQEATVESSLVRCIGDANGDGNTEFAVLDHLGNLRVKSITGALINQFAMNNSSSVADLEVMQDINGNDAPELVEFTAGKVRIWDSLTGSLISMVNVDSALSPIDLELLMDQTGNGLPELAALGQGSVRVKVMDPLNGVINTLNFNTYFNPMDLEIYPDLNGNGSPEIAVLGDHKDPAKGDKIEVRDLATGYRVRDLWIGRGWQVLQQASLADHTGNGAEEVAILRVKSNNHAVNVLLRDTKTGQGLGSLGFDRNYPPTQLLTIADVNGNGADEVVVYGQRFVGGTQKAQIKDSKTKALIRVVFFDKNFVGQDITTCADINGNGTEELVLLGKRARDGKLRVIVKDAKSGVNIGVVDF